MRTQMEGPGAQMCSRSRRQPPNPSATSLGQAAGLQQRSLVTLMSPCDSSAVLKMGLKACHLNHCDTRRSRCTRYSNDWSE